MSGELTLVVDDEIVARKTAQRMLEADGFSVLSAKSGEEGLAVFGENEVGLVVADINMPGIDGLQMIDRMRQQDPDVACVVMTTRPDQEAASGALHSGANGFLRKPFQAYELRQVVTKALRTRERLLLSRRLQEELEESRRERVLLESQFIDTEKLSALGQLAPRIAHEIKTPLQTISGHAELARHWLQEENGGAREEVLGHLEVILPAAEKITGLVQQMFELGKPLGSLVSDVHLADELHGMVAELKSVGIIKHCQITEEYADHLPVIRGDWAQLDQVFRNLILNAAHAMEGQMTQELAISVRCTEDQAGVLAAVVDNGCGIPPDHLESIFRPFFTTRSQGKGTGLGLAIAKTVVERHGGRLTVQSADGVGTTFTAQLPAAIPTPIATE